MPYIIDTDGEIYANPVMGIFIESLFPHFKKILVYGFEAVKERSIINYKLDRNKKLYFISLGSQGKFWDYFQKKQRMKAAIRSNKIMVDILLLRVPSHLAYSVWKYIGKPKLTALLFIGNKYFNSGRVQRGIILDNFHLIRSKLHDRGLQKICSSCNTLIMANSDNLVKIFGRSLGGKIERIHTSSILKNDIVGNCQPRFKRRKKSLLFVGRVCYEKGIRELIEAVQLLNQDSNGRFILNIVGPMGDIGENSLRQLISKYKVLSNVNYHGTIQFGEKLFEMFKNADAYILPSYHEGMPKTIWEAMSQGTPVIVSKLDGMDNYFNNEEDIMFIKPRSAQSIVNAVLRLCDFPELAVKLQENGMVQVKSFTRESQAEKIAHLMKKEWIKSL